MLELDQSCSEGRSLFGSSSDHYGHCCPPVFDPYTLVALLGGIALATFFLRLVIINQVFNGRSFNVFGKNLRSKTHNTNSSVSKWNLIWFLFTGKWTDDPNWLTHILEEVLQTYEEVNNERKLEESSSSDISKRSIDTVTSEYADDYVTISNSTSGRGFCRSEVWHCMSGVLEGGIRYVEKPEDIYR